MMRYIKPAIVIAITCVFGAMAVLLARANSFSFRYSRKYKPIAPVVAVLSDSAALIRGKMLATALCTGCHGSDYAGTELVRSRWYGIVYARNITPGGVVKNFSTADWVNVMRFGVKENGKPVLVMPCGDDYNQMSDYDLGCLIGYMKTVKASDKTYPENNLSITWYGKAALVGGKYGTTIFSAETIRMNDPAVKHSPPVAVTPEYGKYLIMLGDCRYCHGPSLNGGIDTGTGAPRGPNITPGGDFGKWNQSDFIKSIRSGITPSGKKLNPQYMPWASLGVLDDTALRAIYTYLKSIPPLPDAKH